MIDLKEVITKYPECLDSAMKLKSFLADLYPEEKARCSILATIFDVGIAEQIKSGKVDNLSVDSYCNSLEDTYGYSPRLIRECISIWAEAFDANVEVKTVRPRKTATPLSEFKIEDNVLVKYIGSDTDVVIPDCVTKIGGFAFMACKALKSVERPDSVTDIDIKAFEYCSSLKSVEIPDSVTKIGRDAFRDTPWFDSKENGPIYLGKCLYSVKGPLQCPPNLKVKEGTLQICESAFWHCTSLERIVIPNRVTEIGGIALSD